MKQYRTTARFHLTSDGLLEAGPHRSPLAVGFESSEQQRRRVQFIGGPADGLTESFQSDLPLDEVVGMCNDAFVQRPFAHVAIYGLSREAEGLRYRFLQYMK